MFRRTFMRLHSATLLIVLLAIAVGPTSILWQSKRIKKQRHLVRRRR